MEKIHFESVIIPKNTYISIFQINGTSIFILRRGLFLLDGGKYITLLFNGAPISVHPRQKPSHYPQWASDGRISAFLQMASLIIWHNKKKMLPLFITPMKWKKSIMVKFGMLNIAIYKRVDRSYLFHPLLFFHQRGDCISNLLHSEQISFTQSSQSFPQRGVIRKT